MTIDQTAREIAEDIDFGEMSETDLRRSLTAGEIRALPESERYALAHKRRLDAHIEAIAEILSRHDSQLRAQCERLVRDAARFAAEAHKGQKRKYNGRPYIEHPMRVAGRVMLLQDSTDSAIAAAWLHDVIEDCGTTAEYLSDKFGHDITSLVVELTNPSKGSRARRAERKAMDREHICKASLWARRIKAIDRIDNLREMGGSDQDFLKLYQQETLLLCNALRDSNRVNSDRLLGELLTELEDECSQCAIALAAVLSKEVSE